MSSIPNSNPINSIYSLNGIPLFTYGMIGVTTIALACITMMDDSNKSYAKDAGFEQSKTENSSTFSFFSSNKTDETTSEPPNEKSQESMFSSIGFGKSDDSIPESSKTESSKQDDSMFSSIGFGKSEESVSDSPKTEIPKKEESILPSFTSIPTDEGKEKPKQGGKKYRKTKHNLQKYQHNRSKKVSQTE